MTTAARNVPSDALIRAAGSFAIVSGIISAIGIVMLISMFALFATPRRDLGLVFGSLNDICVALQYLLALPIALAMYRILRPYHPTGIAIATVVGIVSMLVVIALQMALVFGALTFQQQGIWVSLAILVGVGAWLIATGLVARATGRLPGSVVMSAMAVPYFGYPFWAFWLGRRLLGW